MGTWPNILQLFSTVVNSYIFMLVFASSKENHSHPDTNDFVPIIMESTQYTRYTSKHLSNLLDDKTYQLAQIKPTNGVCIKVCPLSSGSGPSELRVVGLSVLSGIRPLILLQVQIQCILLKKPHLHFQHTRVSAKIEQQRRRSRNLNKMYSSNFFPPLNADGPEF